MNLWAYVDKFMYATTFASTVAVFHYYQTSAFHTSGPQIVSRGYNKSSMKNRNREVCFETAVGISEPQSGVCNYLLICLNSVN